MLSQFDQTVLFNAANFTLPPLDGAALGQNLTVMKVGLSFLLCPSDDQPHVPGFGRANYRFNLGPTHRWAPAELFPQSFSGPFSVHRAYTPADFTDGLSNTVGASERLQGNWTKGTFKLGGDYLLGNFRLDDVLYPDQAIADCSSLPIGTPEESRGGESWFLSGFHFTCYSHCAPPNATVPDCALHGTTRFIHERVNLDGVFKASSFHRGGVNTLSMDGSVRAVLDSINLSVWRTLATRSGGEVVGSQF
jgi:hypothetical protein